MRGRIARVAGMLHGTMSSSHRALVPVRSTKEPRLARSLDTATPRSVVHVDKRGNVRSPARYRALQGLGYVSMASTAALPVLYGLLLGVPGAVLGMGLAGFFGVRIRHNLTLRRAGNLLVHGDTERAEAVLERLSRARLIQRQTRALAHQNLATCRVRHDDFEGALHHVRRARDLHRRSRGLYAAMAAYLEMHILIGLDRVQEARAMLDTLGPVPEGEYLRVTHWTAELHVCLAEGEHGLAEDELHERARKGLAMTVGSTLLGLTAWAYDHIGDADMSAHLLAEAFDRLADDRIEHMMPKLYAWMVTHRPEPAE